MLGEVCRPRRNSGLGWLFHSRLVGRRRFGGRGSAESQLARVASTVESVCEHAGATSVHVLSVGDGGDVAQAISDTLVARGISAVVLPAEANMDERALLPVSHAILCADSQAKASDVWGLSLLCRGYDVSCLGNVLVRGY